jgi:hypothetical protein
VPAGLVLVTARLYNCANMCEVVDLSYQGAHGAWLDIIEGAPTPSTLGFPLSTPYHVWQGSGEEERATWWLGVDVTPSHGIAIYWERDGIEFTVQTDAALPVDVVEHVANSL